MGDIVQSLCNVSSSDGGEVGDEEDSKYAVDELLARCEESGEAATESVIELCHGKGQSMMNDDIGLFGNSQIMIC